MSRAPKPKPHRPGIGWLLAGYAGIAGFFAVEALIREPGSASRLDAGSDDDGTTQAIVQAAVASAMLAPALRLAPGRKLPRAAAPLGLAMQAAGLGLRVWSMRVLGESYSRTLRTHGEQRVVDDGPYRVVRHPGYLGSLLTWTGFGLTSGSLPAAATVTSLIGRAYGRRIESEERMLVRDLPDYGEYSERTWRLIPYLW